MNTLEHK